MHRPFFRVGHSPLITPEFQPYTPERIATEPENLMTYAHPEHLISTAGLAEAIKSNADNLRIFDATVNLVPAAKGYKAVSGLEDYEKGHIPGAAFLDLIHDLSNTASSFGFTLPSESHLRRRIGQSGSTRAARSCSTVQGT